MLYSMCKYVVVVRWEGIKLGVQPRPHWRPPTQCDRGGADTETNTHSHEYSKNILEQT